MDPRYDQIGIYPPVARLVCIGDLHGDMKVTLKVLKLAGVIDLNVPNNNLNVNNIKWTGKNTFVVQLGDQIDRCRQSSHWSASADRRNNKCSSRQTS
mgnify:CR=1 FL=1